MYKNRNSLNVNGANIGISEDAFVDHCRKARYASITVMDNPNLAQRVRVACEGETIVAVRRYSTNDGIYWDKSKSAYLTPAQYLDYRLSDITQRFPELWLYVLNEPAPVAECLDWLIAVGKEAKRRGRHCILGNIGPSTWEIQQLEDGVFDRYLEYLGSTDFHHAGWHCYTGFALPFSFMTDYDNLRYPGRMAVDRWPNRDSLPVARKSDPSYMGYWHLRRTDWFNKRCLDKGYGIHQKHITEFGVDRMPDLDGNVYREIGQRYGVPGPANEIRGAVTLNNVWRFLWPEWTFEQAFIAQREWADHIYPDDIVSMDWFTYNANGDWDAQFGTSIHRYQGIRDLIEAQTATGRHQVWRAGEARRIPMPAGPDSTIPPDESEPPVIERDMQTRLFNAPGEFSNLRSSPGGADVGDLRDDDVVRVDVKASNRITSGDYEWVYVEFDSLSGWVALTRSFDEMFLLPPETEPPDLPDDWQVTVRTMIADAITQSEQRNQEQLDNLRLLIDAMAGQATDKALVYHYESLRSYLIERGLISGD